MSILTKTTALLLLGLCTGNASAADNPWWRFWGTEAGDTSGAATRDVASRHFTSEQQRLLREFLAHQREQDRSYHDDDRDHDAHYNDKSGKKAKPLPPGLRKKVERGGQLPPGWQKKLARGEVVDDEIWHQSRRLPPDLLERLGAMPPDTDIRYIQDKIYRVMRDTREIIDVLGL